MTVLTHLDHVRLAQLTQIIHVCHVSEDLDDPNLRGSSCVIGRRLTLILLLLLRFDLGDCSRLRILGSRGLRWCGFVLRFIGGLFVRLVTVKKERIRLVLHVLDEWVSASHAHLNLVKIGVRSLLKRLRLLRLFGLVLYHFSHALCDSAKVLIRRILVNWTGQLLGIVQHLDRSLNFLLLL